MGVVVIALSRIDSRLIHGQVIEAWVPYLQVTRLVVADEQAATDPVAKATYDMVVPADIEVVLGPVEQLDFGQLASDSVRTLVLFRDVRSAVAARARGLPLGPLNVGNVHAGPGRVSVSRSVFLDQQDTESLRALAHEGMQVRVQAVPQEKSVELQ